MLPFSQNVLVREKETTSISAQMGALPFAGEFTASLNLPNEWNWNKNKMGQKSSLLPPQTQIRPLWLLSYSCLSYKITKSFVALWLPFATIPWLNFEWRDRPHVCREAALQETLSSLHRGCPLSGLISRWNEASCTSDRIGSRRGWPLGNKTSKSHQGSQYE